MTWIAEYWSLANVAAVQMSPVVAPAVPVTCWEEIAIAPSEIAVQFGPSPPSARLKLSEAVPVPAKAACGSMSVGTRRKLKISNNRKGQRTLVFEQ